VTPAERLPLEFTTLDALIRHWAQVQGERPAITDATHTITWAELDAKVDRIAARLQGDGVSLDDTVAIGGANAIGYALAMFAALRIGAAPALLTVSATADAQRAMLADSGARHLFLDRAMAETLGDLPPGIVPIAYEEPALSQWMAPAGAQPRPVDIRPEHAFNIIYSSGTTGTPKGIVQSHGMRWGHLKRAGLSGFDPTATALYATPLYSNTTLVSFLAAVAGGSRTILMPKFDTKRYCEIAEAERVTHTMLVPVQYQRMMAFAEFDSFDLSAFRYKACTSAPFSADLKADLLQRWPGALVEFYGMTEGGASCVLRAHEHPDKLHTVGKPIDGHELLLIDEQGREVPQGQVGEVVGRSETMMTGYHGLADKTREAEWYDPAGRRFIRHGDLARFDADGFLELVGRAKDVIISGGFNIYPVDLEDEFRKHPEVADVAVIGAPSQQWGETPVAFVVMRDAGADLDAILAAVNLRLGKTQRLSAAYAVDELPRSTIGKVLKRELRDRLAAA
jgi:acyl-CoA synthetase (AMP-forming)/AMP-acid ligase II